MGIRKLFGRRPKHAARKQQPSDLQRQHEEMMALQRRAQEQQTSTIRPVLAPGWYPDTERPGHVRWWDGSTWTQKVRPA